MFASSFHLPGSPLVNLALSLWFLTNICSMYSVFNITEKPQTSLLRASSQLKHHEWLKSIRFKAAMQLCSLVIHGVLIECSPSVGWFIIGIFLFLLYKCCSERRSGANLSCSYVQVKNAWRILIRNKSFFMPHFRNLFIPSLNYSFNRPCNINWHMKLEAIIKMKLSGF